MNVVIPLRDKQTIIKDWELHHSILSIRKFTNAEHIFIIGKPRRKPNIPGTKLFWIDYRDRYQAVNPFRHENVRLKVLKACHVLKEPFLLCNDDIFFMQECDITKLPLYYWKTCREFAEEKGGRYRKMLQEIDGLNFELHTPMAFINALYGNVEGMLNFELHTPMIIQPKIFEESTKEMKLYRSLYGNASDLPKQEMPDVKSYGEDSAERFRELPFISTSEAHLKTDVKMLIKEVVG